jgi:uncharacterized phage-associated protein
MEKDYSIEKFINCALYFAKKTDPNKIGILKLNKLLYYIDFEHYKKYGRPILGDIYFKMELGPVPSFSYNLFNLAFYGNGNDNKSTEEIKSSISLKKVKVKDYNINIIVPKKKFNKDIFSSSEIKVMENVAKKHFSDTGTSMSKKTHAANTPWSKTDQNQVIDYDLVLDKSSISKEYTDYWKKREKELDSLFV